MNDVNPESPATTAARIAALPSLPFADIKRLWRKLFGDEIPNHRRAFLEKRIAYRWQEIECRKSNEGRALLERNARRIAKLVESGEKLRPRDYHPVPGTVLSRTYHSVEHRVTVSLDGAFSYNGKPYRSLSRIAEEITGQRWSGPLFFGLREPSSKKRRATT